MNKEEQILKFTKDTIENNTTFFSNEAKISYYLNQDPNMCKYFFHGSPILLANIETRQSHDSEHNEKNIDNAIFLTPSLKIASAYAFKDTIKQESTDLDWNFQIKSFEEIPIMIMENVKIDENIDGYIYVFDGNNKFINDPVGTLQYKCFETLKPIDILKIKYKDFSEFYQIKNKQKAKTN